MGWVLAPTTILGSVGWGIVWGLGKWGYRRTSWGKKGREEVEIEREVERERREGTREDGSWRGTQGPRATPW